MASRDELEQENQILETEVEDAHKRIRELEAELAIAQGNTIRVQAAAKEKGVELALATTPAEQAMQEVDDARKGIADDLQAISELVAPPAQPEVAMTPLEHVRAANAKTAELGRRAAAANTLISRIAAILGITSWDEEGTELRNAINELSHLPFFLNKRQQMLTREIEKLGARRADPGSAAERNELLGWKAALQWVTSQIHAKGADPDIVIPTSLPEDAYGLMRVLEDGTTSWIRRATNGDAGDLEVMICRDDRVVRRTVISGQQLNLLDYFQRTPATDVEKRMDVGATPYR